MHFVQEAELEVGIIQFSGEKIAKNSYKNIKAVSLLSKYLGYLVLFEGLRFLLKTHEFEMM